MKIALYKIKEAATQLGVNLEVLDIYTLKHGVEVEMEHCKYKRLDVTSCNIIKTMKIALSHITEYPDYYKRLERLEKQAKKYWSDKKKLKVFL